MRRLVYSIFLALTLVCYSLPAMAQVFNSLVDITAVDGKLQSFGQGIIIDSNGVIATSKHILGEHPEEIYVFLSDGRKFEAKVIQNAQADVSLIKIEPPAALRAMTLADSSQVEIGNPVLAIANASNTKIRHAGEIIQVYREAATDKVAILEVNIPLKSGDSGGPILNEQGFLLGLIMANQASDHNRSYAIASNTILDEYRKYKHSTLISRL